MSRHHSTSTALRSGVLPLALVLLLGSCAASPAFDSVQDLTGDDLRPHWDAPTNGHQAKPDSELTKTELSNLLRVRATTLGGPTTCKPEDLETTVAFIDAALGHRYGRIIFQNTSPYPCTLEGFPGIGARGQWGDPFLLETEQRDPFDPAAVAHEVAIAPGAYAFASLEWTGELAGAYSQPISIFAVQLASDQTPIAVPVTAELSEREGVEFTDNTGIDISMLTTVRVGPFQLD